MFLIIYLFVLTLNFFLVLTKKRSNGIAYMSFLVFTYVLYGNNRISDYMNYSRGYIYNSIYNMDTDNVTYAGYAILKNIFVSIGVEYNIFRLTINIIILVALFIIINKYSANPHLIYFFYSIFLIFMDAIQIRYFWATIVSIIAINIYISKGKKYLIKSIILFALGFSLHYGVIMYPLAFFLVEILGLIKGYYKYIILAVAVFGILVIRYIDFTQFSSIINQTTLRRYVYTAQNAGYGFLFPWIIQAIQYFRIKILYKSGNEIQGLKDQETVNKLYRLTYSSFLYCPLYILNVNFYRYLRGTLLIFLCIGMGIVQKNHIKKSRIIIFLTLIECVGWILFETIFDNFINTILIPTFW